jgi:hypothetical protein
MPTIFGVVYDEKPGIAGLHYLALGVGLSSASQINARTLDKVYVYFKNKNGGIGRPEFRLREWLTYLLTIHLWCIHTFSLASMVPGTICLPIGLLITGWSVQKKVFWLVPDIVSYCGMHVA